jgi:hypothetical protein
MLAIVDPSHLSYLPTSESKVVRVTDQDEMIDLYTDLLPQITRMFKRRDIYQTTPMLLLDCCLCDDYTMWRADRGDEFQGIAITQINDWPSDVRTFDVLYVIGKTRHWDDVLAGWEAFLQYAREKNCTRLTGQTRTGWKPYIKHFGLKQHTLNISKEI